MVVKRTVPEETRPPRHTWVFTQAETMTALKDYLRNHGEEVPEGPNFLWGIEHDRDGPTLVIDED